MALIDDIVNKHPLDIADDGFQGQSLDSTDSAVHGQSDQMDANAAIDSQGHYYPENSTDLDGEPGSQPNTGIEDHTSDHFQQPIWVDEHSVHGFAGHSDIVHQFDDANHNMIPDHLEVDMNGNGIPDDLDVQDYN